MSALSLLGASEPRPFTRWLPPIAGLVAGGTVATIVCRLPLVHSLSWAGLVGSAVERAVGVFLASALAAWGTYLIQPRATRLAPPRLILRTSLDAIWLAPLALFIRENSAWAVAMAAMLVASVAKSCCLLQNWSGHRDESESLVLRLGRNPFSPPESSPGFWRLVRAAGAALCAQTGAVAGFAGYPFAAALFVGISSAAWTWSFSMDASPESWQTSPSSQSTSRILLVVAMAIVFTAGGLMRYLRSTYRIGGSGIPSPHHSRHAPIHASQRGEPGREKASEGGERRGQSGRENVSEGSFPPASDANSGIILWPTQQTYTKLVAPVPAMGNGLLKSSRSAKPLIIPFNGVYWFFKAPDLQPPGTSRQAHGSPELLDIHSTDRRPLSMEAHEHFGSMISVDCCSRIQISIRNADLYSETVSLELLLINSSLPGKPSQSLGTIMAKSARPWKIYEKPSPTAETLNFPIPANLSLRRFDEVMIVFRLAAFRADDGAKIAIDHFVLVPRGI
jgi:hypothetical protein